VPTGSSVFRVSLGLQTIVLEKRRDRSRFRKKKASFRPEVFGKKNVRSCGVSEVPRRARGKMERLLAEALRPYADAQRGTTDHLHVGDVDEMVSFAPS
jgi:hypothetical protein